MTTVGEAYGCLLAHYANASRLDDRQLLGAAFGGVVGYLESRHMDQTGAVLPALTGDRARDWRTFRSAYQQVAAHLPHDTDTQRGLAVKSIQAMVESLHDDHTYYGGASQAGTGSGEDLGMYVRFPAATLTGGPGPAVVADVLPNGPAEQAGLRAGDQVTAVDGRTVSALAIDPAPASPAFDPAAYLLPPARLGWIHGGSAVTLTITRRVASVPLSVTVQARTFPPFDDAVEARALPGGVAYARFHAFTPAAGTDLLAALSRLGLGQSLRGVVVDVRGNTGGDPAAIGKLLSAFTHRHGLSTDDSVPLLHVPLVLLVDGASVSAADALAATVRDYHLGRLVGERTGGVIGGEQRPYRLDDGSMLDIDFKASSGGPDGEILDGIGVPPDQFTTSPSASDLSAGHDPAIAQALIDLTGAPQGFR